MFFEISEIVFEMRVFIIIFVILKKFFMVLNECMEWGRVIILMILVDYFVFDVKELEYICERVIF